MSKSDDPISRSAAIDATRNAKCLFRIKSDIDFANYQKEIQEILNNILDAQEKALNELPSAQPEKVCVAEVKVEGEELQRCIDEAVERIKVEVRPEFVRCKDCLMHGVCRFEQGLGLDGYCSQAERRTDECDERNNRHVC